MDLLVIDNYDSFTYNLVQYLGELGVATQVVRNDVEEIDALAAREVAGLVISPGPGTPDDAGVSVAAIARFAEAGKPVLGVCLGHQSIGVVYGGRIVRAGKIMHGKTSRIQHDGSGVFSGLPEGFEATRYHSLVIEQESFPGDLEITARSEDGEIMGVAHRSKPVWGVQFHPESILTRVGHDLLRNFAERCAAGPA